MSKRILSIAGGGIFGLIPALILQEIEARTGKASADLFDLMAGCSTGGIIACGLSIRVPASQLVDLYENHGAEIFSSSVEHDLADGYGLCGPKYSAAALEALLQKTLGAATLSQPGGPRLLVPSSRCDADPTAFWFKSWDGDNYPLWEVARATSAAPYYFPAAVVSAIGGPSHTFVDGGLFANNPEDYAVDCAQQLWPSETISLLSLGTGFSPLTVPVKPDWGAADWLSSLVEFIMQCGEEASAERAQLALGDARVRFDPLIGGAMDDVGAANITAIKTAAAGVISSDDFQLYLASIS